MGDIADYHIDQYTSGRWGMKINNKNKRRMIKMANQQIEATNVTTGQVRLSYVHLFQPYARQGQEPRYSVTILIPKSDVATKQRIDAAIQTAIQKGISGVWNGARPPQPKTPIWDGDGVRQNGEPFGPEAKGHWVLTASSKQQQAIVDANLNPIINQTEVYSGMYGRVNINFFAFSNSGNRGIGAGLGPVQKLADGEPLGGQVSAEQAFGNAPTPQQPQYGQQQPTYQQQGYGQGYVAPQQPTYAPPVQPGYVQPTYPQQPQQPVQYDPITGKPLNGGIMGL